MSETKISNIPEQEIEEHLTELKPVIESMPEKSRGRFIELLRSLGKVGLFVVDSFAVGMYMGSKVRYGAKTFEQAEDEAAREFGPKISEELGLRKKK
jgi:hypothetical protein